MSIAIVTDSGACLPVAVCEAAGITVVSLRVIAGRQASAATTSRPAAGEFMDIYSRLLSTVDAVVSVHMSHRLSGTVAAARFAASSFSDRVTVVDAGTAGAALGYATLAAARATTRDGAASAAMATAAATRTAFVVTPSSASQRSRLANAVIGARSRVGIDLIDGIPTPTTRLRTKEQAQRWLLEQTREWLGAGRGQVTVQHSGAEQAAADLAATLSETHATDVALQEVDPVIAVHVGDHAIGIAALRELST